MKRIACLVIYLWTTVTVAMAYTGVKLVPQLVILGLVGVSGLLQGLFWRKSWRRFVAAPIVVLSSLAASVASLFQMAIWLFPPVTEDGHGVMAIGQTFGGIAGGFLLSVLISYLYFTRFKPDGRLEAVWVWGLTAVLAVTFVADRCL